MESRPKPTGAGGGGIKIFHLKRCKGLRNRSSELSSDLDELNGIATRTFRFKTITFLIFIHLSGSIYLYMQDPENEMIYCTILN